MDVPSKNRGGSWNIVQRNRRSTYTGDKWDILKNDNGGKEGKITSFFFTDFNGGWRVKDLFFEFKNLGVVNEIVIPAKRDWRGEKYGFVYFVNMENPRLLEIKLDNLWLEGRKLKVNISKFHINKQDNSNVIQNRTHRVEAKLIYNNKIKGSSGLPARAPRMEVGGGRSYAEILKPKILNNNTREVSNKEDSSKIVFFSATKEETKKFDKFMVGVVRKPGMAYGVCDSLLEEGIFSIKATPLGPNLCLLEEEVEGDLELLLRDAGEWRKAWFK